MTKVSQSEGCALYGSARILAMLHKFSDSSEANLWLEEYKKSEIQVTADPPAPYHKPILMDVTYFVGYIRNQKVKVQIEIQRMLREDEMTGTISEEKAERWTPLFGTVWVYEDDVWQPVADYQFNWVTDRLFLKKQYREYPYA